MTTQIGCVVLVQELNLVLVIVSDFNFSSFFPNLVLVIVFLSANLYCPVLVSY